MAFIINPLLTGTKSRIFVLTLGAGVTPGRGDGSAVLSRWQGPRPPTAGRLNTECRDHPWLPVPTGPEIDRLRDSIFQSRKGLGVAGIPQRRDFGLREALIPARQVLGKRHILDLTRTDLRDYYPGGVVEAARLSGADVKDAVAHWTFGKRQVYADDVVNKNKIAPLLSVGVSIGALEQPCASALLQLPVELIHHRRHFALVGFARTIDVEVSQAGHGTLRFRGNDPDVIVEREFGQPVEVEREFVLARRRERARRAVHGS